MRKLVTKNSKSSLTKLSQEQIDMIRTDYNFGDESLRSIAQRYNISHEYVRLIANADVVTKEQVSVHKLITEHLNEFIDLVDRGVSPVLAAQMFAVTPKAFNILIKDNPDIYNQIISKQAQSLSKAEICLASASGDSWKAALERLSRNPLTRNDYITTTNTNSSPSISVVMNWNRDEILPAISMHADCDASVCSQI